MIDWMITVGCCCCCFNVVCVFLFFYGYLLLLLLLLTLTAGLLHIRNLYTKTKQKTYFTKRSLKLSFAFVKSVTVFAEECVCCFFLG